MNEYGRRNTYRVSREAAELISLEEESRREEDIFLRRRRQRERERRRLERLRRRRRALLVRMACVMLIFIGLIFLIRALFFSNPVARKITVEAGTEELKATDFLRNKKKDIKVEFVTDMSEVSLDHVGKHKILLKAKGKERKSTLIVEDTTAPKAEAAEGTVNVGGKIASKYLVKNIEDGTDVECRYKEVPDLSEEGTIDVTVVLTDEAGNTAEVDSVLNVITDEEAPVIDGVAPLTAFIGDPVSYKSGITVTDNCTVGADLEVDNSAVDTEKPGTYDVIYTATDQAGNKTTVENTITMKEKPDNYVEPEEVYALADEVLAEITTDDMTLKEKARAIYKWTKENVGYINTSDKDSWTNGAYQGFMEGEGDCFVFFATAKALLTEAEIPNLDVVKSDTSESSHFWSLIDCGDGWYHFDTTPRYGGGDFFMLTDAEILDYSKAHDNSHIFDQSLYPATPTEDSTIE